MRFEDIEEELFNNGYYCPKCNSKCEIDKRIDGNKFDTYIVCTCGYEHCVMAGYENYRELK